MANIYLQVDFKSGNIFQFSKTIQEGYESHINTKGVESWRKFFKKGLYAKLEGVSIRDTNFGKEISLYTKMGNGDTAYLNFPLLDQKRNLASYAESLITVLPSLKVGESYRFFPYNIKDDGATYGNIGVSVVLANLENESVLEGVDKPKRLSYSYRSKDGIDVKGDIPAIVWEEDYTGAKIKNESAKNKFLYEALNKFIAGLSSQAPTQASTPAPQAAAPKTEPKVETPTHDDLPF